MDKLRALYDKLSSDGLYTKTFEEFQNQFAEPSSQKKLYNKLSTDGLYTKTSEEFQQQFFSPSQPEVTEDPLKKKEDTVSVSEDGLSESQRKSKEIFKQIGRKGFQRVPEEEMPITEQAVAQMDTQFEKPSRAQVGKLESADFTKGRFDFEDVKKVQYTPSEEEVIATDIRLKNPKKKIVTNKDIDSYKEEQEVERKNKERLKGLLLNNYNAVASQQNLEMISPAEYVSLFEDKEDLDGKMFQEFSEAIGTDILSSEEINNINNRNEELIARGEEPVSLDFYINLKRNELFKQYAESKNLLPSQKKQRLIRDIITADSRLLIPSSEIDLTLSLDDETRRANIEGIHKNKLKRDFIIDNISTELYNKNKGRVLTSDSFEEVYNKSLENFYDSYGRQEWEAYKKISGNTDPLLIGTEYENDNKDNSLLTARGAVVVGDEDATVQNLKRLFPEFRIEGTGITGDFVTISTVAPDGGVVNSLEIFLGEDNEPEKRIREFMQGALLSKKDKAFLSEDKSESGDPLWKLKMYDYMLSNPQKFGDKNAPSMYGTTRAFETVDFDQINKYLDQYKDNISDKMMTEFRRKMAQADAFYKGELAQKGTLSSAIGAGITEALMSPAKFVSMTGANIYDAFGGEGAKEAKEGLMSAIESSINQISGTTPESIAERDLLQTVLNTMANSATHMALGMGNPYATFGSFLTATAPRTERLLKDEDIPEYQKGLIGLLMGTVEGALETYGAQSLITPATSGMFKNLILTSIKDLPSDASQEAIEQAVRNSVKTKLLSGGLKVAEGMIYEGATEGTQALAEDINKRLFNAIYDKEIFQVPDWTTKEGREQWAEQIVEQVKIGGLAGGGFASVFHGTKSLAKGFDAEAKESVKTFEKDYADIMDDAKFEKSIAEIKSFSASKQITQEQAELLEVELDESREIAQSIPETLSSRRKMEAFNLLKEKRGLQRSMQNKSPELVASQEDRVKEIDGLLKIVGDINVAEETVKEEIDKSRPESIENVTRSEEIENIMTPQEQVPVTEEVTEEATVTEEAPVKEEQPTVPQEALETQPITKITTELVAKEKKGELTQEETDGVLLGIMEKVEAENAKRKSPLSPEQAQKKLGKMQQRVFEANKNRYLELSGVMTAAQEQVVEEAPVVEQVTEEVVQETPVVKDKVTKKKPKKTTTKNLKTQKGVEYKVELDENDNLVSASNPKTGKQIKKFAERKKRDGTTSLYLSSVWSELKAKSLGVITQSQAVKERNEKLKKALEATEQPRNTYEAARDFLIRGGQISSESASRETGESKKQLKWLTRGARGFTNDSELPSVERASEIIWESSERELDPQDIRNELIDIIMSTGSRTELADALIEEVEDAEAYEFLGSLSGEAMSQYEDILVTEDYLSELTQEQKEEYYKDKIQYYEQEEKTEIKTEQLTESVAKDAKTKQRIKKEKPKKQEAKISEQVQKEIDRAERLRDRIVAEKTNRLSRTKGFEQKEDLRDEIRQDEKKYNNIITELKEGKRTKFQVKETQETKTDASRYQEFIFVLKRSFPSVEVVTTQAEFDTLLKETGANELITKDQSVYGAVYQGKLYLNPSLENYNTPIHEFGHVWMNVAKEANPKLYDKGIGLVKGSEYEQQIKNNPAYKDSTEQEVLEEALATAIGDKGEAFVKESKKNSFKDWLSALYGFVRKLTGISKYTAKQLEDITLDEFTQAVAVDLLSGRQLFEGAEITDMGDALQLMAEKGVDLDAAMSEAINDMIDKGFKSAEIKGVLLQMGYKARAINDALVVAIDADMKLPNDFANIDGGVRDGEALFRSVMQKLKEFAAPKLVKRSIKEQYNEAKKDGYEGTLKEYTEEQNNKKVDMLKQANPLLTLLTNEEILEKYPNIQNEVVEKQQKSRAEIRAKAIELLEAEATFQAQDNLTRLELINSMDRTMKTRSNKEVQKRISAIKQTLKGVREGAKDLQAAKTRIKNLIREELLPMGVSITNANNLVRIVEKATKDTYESSVAKVMKVVDAQISKKKKETINKMLKLAKQKATVKNKRARTSPEATRFFTQATVILNALSKNDTRKLESIEEELRKKETSINEIIDNINDGIEVNDKQQELVSLAQAFDILGSLNKQDLSETEDALNLMKSKLESGMESLRTRRAARKAVYDRLKEEANKNIKDGYEFLFDEDGQPLEPAELENLSDELKQEMWNNITSIPKLLNAVNKYTKLQAQNFGKFSMFFDNVKNLGTLLRGLDRKGKFFEKNVFDKLNNMEEEYLQGYFNTMDMLESELDAIGIKGGIDGLNKIINKEFVVAKTVDLKDIKLSLKKSARPVVKLTRGEAMRIYALSKNDTQMSRLKDQGFTPAKMQQIEMFIGPQLVEATDVIVDFLSSSYYESINKVYEDVNDISLRYIENYFPTKTSPSKGSTAAEFDKLSKEIKSGNFAGVFSAQQASALKERSSEDAIDIRYKDFSSVIEDHFRTMERFKAYAMGTKEINIIVNHTTSVKTLLDATRLDKTIENRIMAAINPNAVQELFESSKGGKAFTFFQRQFTGITLALKPIQALKQMTSFINAWEDYSLRGQEKRIPVVDTVLDSLGFSYDIAATFILLPKVWGKYSTYNKAMYSASFKDRVRQSFKTADLLGLEQGVGARRRSKKTRLGRTVRKAKVVANSPTLVGDIMGVMGYMAAYRANIRNGMSQKEAIEKFNKYNETQQTRRGTDKVGLQTSTSMYTRVFTMFGSSLFLQLNKVMQSVTKLRRGSISSFQSAVKGDWEGTKENFPKEKDLRALYVNLAVANVLFAAMSNIFKYHPFMDDDDEITEEEMERIKKAQNALKRGKEISDEDIKLIERYQFKLDKEDVLKAYSNAKYGLNQLFNLPLVGPSLQQNWDYYYWNNPNAFSTDKKSRAVNPLEQTFSRNFWDRTLNDVSESESTLKTIIDFSLGVDVKRPLAMVEALQSYWGDDEMYREGFEELNDDGERKFKGTFEDYKAKQMEENMYELLGISYSYRPGSGKDWTKKKMTITVEPKAEKEEETSSSGPRKRRKRRTRSRRKRR